MLFVTAYCETMLKAKENSATTLLIDMGSLFILVYYECLLRVACKHDETLCYAANHPMCGQCHTRLKSRSRNDQLFLRKRLGQGYDVRMICVGFMRFMISQCLLSTSVAVVGRRLELDLKVVG